MTRTPFPDPTERDIAARLLEALHAVFDFLDLDTRGRLLVAAEICRRVAREKDAYATAAPVVH